MAYAIAAGHNAATPTALHLLSGELFWRYEGGGVADEFYQLRQITGAHTVRLLGRPRIRWGFPLLSASEFEYLRETFFASLDYASLTITTPNRNKAENPYERWNVTGYWIDLSEGSQQILRNGFWEGAILEFMDCVSLGT